MGGDRKQAETLQRKIISIHAPAWGATIESQVGFLPSSNFNSRPRVGGDVEKRRVYSRLIISIHAPAWGATRSGDYQVQAFYSISIHAPAWGATLPKYTYPDNIVFQFTPPRGGRPARCTRGFCTAPDFNSRPRVGGDD